MIWTENDFFDTDANSFGFTANGTVTTPTGDAYRLQVGARVVFTDPALPPVSDHVQITLKALK